MSATTCRQRTTHRRGRPPHVCLILTIGAVAGGNHELVALCGGEVPHDGDAEVDVGLGVGAWTFGGGWVYERGGERVGGGCVIGW